MRFLFYGCKDTTKYRETSPFRPIFIRKRLHDKNRQEYMHLLPKVYPRCSQGVAKVKRLPYTWVVLEYYLDRVWVE